MLKRDELSKSDSCLNKAADDEWVFVLRAKDPVARRVIQYWCVERLAAGLNVIGDDKITEALSCAMSMEQQRKERF
jgi:hypothetical protein